MADQDARAPLRAPAAPQAPAIDLSTLARLLNSDQTPAALLGVRQMPVAPPDLYGAPPAANAFVLGNRG